MTTPASPAWVAVGWTMIHLSWAGILIGAMGAIARRTLGSARPETRYAAALASLLALVAAPVAIFAAVYDPPGPAAGMAGAAQPATSAAPAIRGGAGPSIAPAAWPRLDEPRRPTAPPSRAESLVPYLPWVWMAGSLATLALLATGLVGVEGLRRSSRPIGGGPIAALVGDLAGSLGIAGRVAVGVCERIASPVLVGIIRPMILLPPAALCGWSPEQLEMVLVHELAHLRRRDNLVNLAQRVAESLLFFHPAAWWLSSWVRLERELCCDRLVVDRLGEPRAYAEMLASMARPGRRARAAMALADGPMLTRIRRLFNLEDRSMKLSMPEGFGVAGAFALVAALALGSRAGTPNDLEARRSMAARAVAELEAMHGPRGRSASRINALQALARAQIQLGDRRAGVATLQRAFEAIEEARLADADEERDRIDTLIVIPRALRTAGEADAARAMLGRLARRIEGRDVKPTGPSRLETVEGSKDTVVLAEHRSSNFALAESLGYVAQERIELGDRDEALRLLRRMADCLEGEPAGMRAIYLPYLGAEMDKAGDPAGARVLVDRARKLADGALTPEEKGPARSTLAIATARMGDLDGALAMLAPVDPTQLNTTLDGLVREMADYDNRAGWYGPGLLKILIGADLYRLNNPEMARRELPRYAEALGRVEAPLARARSLARVAHLQAKAGDCDGAVRTAAAIPAIHRADFPGPSDGFYDAIRPVVLALIARERAEAGDRSRAEAEFGGALAEARAIADPGERTIALMVIGRERARIGDKPGALAVLGEAEPLVASLPEPRRSRSLVMIASERINAGDLPGAEASARAIRPYPKTEKIAALQGISEAHRRAGDPEGWRATLRAELAVCEAEAPKDFKLGPVQRLKGIAIDTFIDPDLESMVGLDQFTQADRPILIRGLLEGPEAALKLVRSLPAEDPAQVRRGVVTRKRSLYVSLVAVFAHRGDFAGARMVIDSIAEPETRLSALYQMAYVLEGTEVK